MAMSVEKRLKFAALHCKFHPMLGNHGHWEEGVLKYVWNRVSVVGGTIDTWCFTNLDKRIKEMVVLYWFYV